MEEQCPTTALVIDVRNRNYYIGSAYVDALGTIQTFQTLITSYAGMEALAALQQENAEVFVEPDGA